MTVRKLAAAAGAAALLAFGLGLTASASTLSCVGQESCGGADLAFTGHGNLSLAALGADHTLNGGFGYNDEHVGFASSGASDGTQDFTVFQDSSEAVPGKGGVYGFGNYVVMYTPGGHLPFDVTGLPRNSDGSVTVTANDETFVPYCVSVEDTYPKVNGKTAQRWALVLRNCFAWSGTSFTIGGKSLTGAPVVNPTPTPAVTTTPAPAEVEDTVTHPDLYQVWAPTEVPGPFLEFQDVALNSTHWRHGFTTGHNFVMDDRGWGGSGTWGLAYPDQGQLNQEFTIIGCTKPVTVFNNAYFNCPS